MNNNTDTISINYNNDDNEIISIPERNVMMEFEINKQKYIAFTEEPEREELEIMFAKSDTVSGVNILRNIEDYEEYQIVIEQFNKRISLLEG